MSEISQRYGMEKREVDDKNRVDISGVEKGHILLTAVVTETARAFGPRSSGHHQACHVVHFQPQGDFAKVAVHLPCHLDLIERHPDRTYNHHPFRTSNTFRQCPYLPGRSSFVFKDRETALREWVCARSQLLRWSIQQEGALSLQRNKVSSQAIIHHTALTTAHLVLARAPVQIVLQDPTLLPK